jgi:hypothetical protein
MAAPLPQVDPSLVGILSLSGLLEQHYLSSSYPTTRIVLLD